MLLMLGLPATKNAPMPPKLMGPLAIVLLSIAVARRAEAQNLYLCCDVAIRPDGSCISQSTPCAQSTQYGIALSNVSAAAAQAYPLEPGYAGAYFPPGVDGYMSWSQITPWVGFCLDAPSTKDPAHAGPTEPLGCLAISLAPGLGGEMADVEFPISSRWDAYQLCYGPQNGATDSGIACQNPNDLNDPTVSPTPVSASCCGPPALLRAPADLGSNPNEWHIGLADEIPAVPPPVLIYAPDGGIVADYDPDAGDYFGAIGDACVNAYNEMAGCGSPPNESAAQYGAAQEGASAAPNDAATVSEGGATSCVPTTCAAQHQTCAVIPDGCGGTLDCVTVACSQGGGCSATPIAADVASSHRGLLSVLALAFTRWRWRRRSRTGSSRRLSFNKACGPSGARNLVVAPDLGDSPRIEQVGVATPDPPPLPNPADPGRPDGPDDCADDWIDVVRVRELVAAAARLTPTAGPVGVLLRETLKALEPRAGAPSPSTAVARQG
jgi:hypothetical protein